MSDKDWAPKRIWLQRGIGEEGSHTWCDDRIGTDSIGDELDEAEYVLVEAPENVIADTAKPLVYLSTDPAKWDRCRIKKQGDFTVPAYAAPAIDTVPEKSLSIAGDKRVRPRIDETGLTPQCPAIAMTKEELDALPDWVMNAKPPEAP